MARASVLTEATYDLEMLRSLADVALYGLRETYCADQAALPYTRSWDGRAATCQGRSIRYALISLLGLAKGAAVVGSHDDLAASLWRRIASGGGTRGLSAGDFGLGLWARALHRVDIEAFTADCALRAYHKEPNRCDSVDLAWLLLGADHAVLAELDVDEAERLAADAKHALLALYNPVTSFFYRHTRRRLASRVSRRVACFANQIYPVMALSVHARRTGCREAAAAAVTVSDKLCHMQGPLGQWWWLYDASSGDVVEGYPVFSVHQDGMAPMALVEVMRAAGQDYTSAIELGFKWTFGDNELAHDLVLREHGLILRDLHRRGIGRARRALRGALWCLGRRNGSGRGHQSARFAINHECRPYHLGWVLYAAGTVHEIVGWRQRSRGRMGSSGAVDR